MLAEAGKEFDVGHGRRPRLAGFRIDPKHGVVAGRNLRLPVAQHEGELPVAVENLEPLRRTGQGVLQRGTAHAHHARVFIDRQPSLLEKAEHRRMENLDSALGQDVDRRFVDLPDLLVGENGQGGKLHGLPPQSHVVFCSTNTAA